MTADILERLDAAGLNVLIERTPSGWRAETGGRSATGKRVVDVLGELTDATETPAEAPDPINKKARVRRVFALLEQRYELSREELLAKDIHKHIVGVRHIAYWLLRKFELSYPEIGLEMQRDHTTVMPACVKIEQRRAKDESYRQKTDKLLLALGYQL